MGRPQIGRDERLDQLPGQLAALVAEHLFSPPVDQRERAIVAGQDHPVGEGVDEPAQHRPGDGRGPRPARRPGRPLPGRWPWRTGVHPATARCRCEGDHRCRRSGRGGRLQRRVDRDDPVQPVEAEHPAHDLGGNHQPQLRAVRGGPLVGPHHRIGARVIARSRRGHIHDQLGGAPVDHRQQLLADLVGVRHIDVPRKGHHRLPAHPPLRVAVLRHSHSPGTPGESLVPVSPRREGA